MIKKFIKNIIKATLEVFGFKLVKIKPPKNNTGQPALKMKHIHDPSYSFMVDSTYQKMLYDELLEYAEHFFSADYLEVKDKCSMRKNIADFFNIYSSRKYTDNTSGSGFHNAFWIFLFCRTMDPNLIVESGVWKGHTTWLMEQACPDAKIFGFDLNLKQLEYKNLKAKLIEDDWNNYDFQRVDPDRSFIFFDCHVNHAKRILEAKEKGFRHLIFDDNPPIHKIYSHIPGIPTAHMIYSGQAFNKTEISWFRNDREITKPIDPNEVKKARNLIKHHRYFPDVGGPTRYGGFAFLTYVQL